VWKERRQASVAVCTYIADWPSTIVFVHGPQGSGKTGLIENVLKDTSRHALTTDCCALQNATSDSKLITVLAKQTSLFSRSSTPSTT
jgi:Ni2+-binding GTPase involved in maturation of urease and hydrogenase